MFQLIKDNKNLFQFLSTCLAGYVFWVIFYNHWIGPNQQVDLWLSGIEAKEVTALLNLIGYNVEHVREMTHKHAFYCEGERIVGFAHSCNGLILFPLFSIFIIASKGSWKRKLVYIIIGCFLIYHVNIIRIAGLFLVKLYHPESLQFNHKYTFTILVYSFIFYLWYLWINTYSKTQEKSNV